MSSWQGGSRSNNNRKQTNSRNKFTDELAENATSGQNSNNQSSTFDKLTIYLTKTHPEYSISDFTEALSMYREEKQTLAGIPLARIEEDIVNILRRKYLSTENVLASIPPEDRNVDETELSVTSVLWSTFRRLRERQHSSIKTENHYNTSTEEQCPICLENLSLHITETFPCQHTFHRNCLEEWFKVERTCPMCRKMLLFNDEYPDLK